MGQSARREICAVDLERSFACSTRVSTLEIGNQTALFCEQTRKKRLFELNETASQIWRAIAAGRTGREAALSLEALGAPPDIAREYVAQQIEEWLRLGHLVPTDVLARTGASPSASLSIEMDEMCAGLLVFGDADASAISDAFATIAVDAPTPSGVRISVVGCGDEAYLFRDDAPLGKSHRRHTAPRLKTLLLDAYLRAATHGFCTHGALASLAGRNVFLVGEPGAGKTTLTLALVASGFDYGGDDTVRFDGNGRAKGLSFTAAAKGPSWDVLAPFYPAIMSVPVHERLDGKLVKYVTPARLDHGGFRPLTACLLLQREQGAAARLEDVRPLEVLAAIVRNACIEHPPPSMREPLQALGQNLAAATCARLVYDDLAEAVQVVRAAVAGA